MEVTDDRDLFHAAMWIDASVDERRRATCFDKTGGLHSYANPLQIDCEICIHCHHLRLLTTESMTEAHNEQASRQ
jgi:hypothetical protein